jgi:hypothetical protein
MEPAKPSVALAWQSLEEKYLESASISEKREFAFLTDREKKRLLLDFLNDGARCAKSWVDLLMDGLVADLATPMPSSVVNRGLAQLE